MKKVCFLQKHEVKLGDIVEYNGIKALVTEELIELNPELFRVEKNTQPMYFKCVKGEGNYTKGRIYKQNYSTNYPIVISLTNDKGITENINYWEITYLKYACNCFELTTKEECDKQELLDEAKKRYPVGTVYKHLNSEYTPKIDFLVADKSDYHFDSAGYFQNAIWGGGLDKYYGVVYHEGKWAEILPLKFTTEDGVDIYGDMRTYLVHPNDSDITSCHSLWIGGSKRKGSKYFYHKENALAYIEKHKEKTLEDYEEILFKSENNSSAVFSGKGSYFSIYAWIRDNEPKLYYTKILQLIADDLNNERYIHIRGDTSYHLSNARSVNVHCGDDEGCVYFKSRELVEKAKDILGDKANYLFNQA